MAEGAEEQCKYFHVALEVFRSRDLSVKRFLYSVGGFRVLGGWREWCYAVNVVVVETFVR